MTMKSRPSSARRTPTAPPSRFLFQGSTDRRKALRRPGSAPLSRGAHSTRKKQDITPYVQLLRARPATAGVRVSGRPASSCRTRRLVVTAWGANTLGQCGVADDIVEAPRSVSDLDGSAIVALACGSQHSLVLMRDGGVFAFGVNVCGQLGWAPGPDRGPSRVQGLSKVHVVQVACGARHSVALLRNGRVCGWGSGEMYQLGAAKPTDGTTIIPPQVIPGLAAVVEVSCGHDFTLALTRAGRVLGLGDGSRGQLGNGSFVHSGLDPVQMLLGIDSNRRPARASQLACGDFHSIVLLKCDESSVGPTVLACGDNTQGCLGVLRDRGSINAATMRKGNSGGSALRTGNPPGAAALHTPVVVAFDDGVRVSRVGAGGRVSFAVCAKGRLFTWGCDHHKQLGRCGMCWLPGMVSSLWETGVRVSEVAAGGSHMVALSDTGNVYVWGWAEDGRLGITRAQLSSAAAVPSSGHDSLHRPYLLECFATRGVRVNRVACGDAHTLVAALRPCDTQIPHNSSHLDKLQVTERASAAAKATSVVNAAWRDKSTPKECSQLPPRPQATSSATNRLDAYRCYVMNSSRVLPSWRLEQAFIQSASVERGTEVGASRRHRMPPKPYSANLRAGQWNHFIVQARDSNGTSLASGGDRILVALESQQRAQKTSEHSKIVTNQSKPLGEIILRDRGNGTYAARWRCTHSGIFTIRVCMAPATASPAIATILPRHCNAAVGGTGARAATALQASRDNGSSESLTSVTVVARGGANLNTSDLATMPKTEFLDVHGSPFILQLAPGPPHAPSCILTGVDDASIPASARTTDESIAFKLTPCAVDGNVISSLKFPAQHFSVRAVLTEPSARSDGNVAAVLGKISRCVDSAPLLCSLPRLSFIGTWRIDVVAVSSSLPRRGAGGIGYNADGLQKMKDEHHVRGSPFYLKVSNPPTATPAPPQMTMPVKCCSSPSSCGASAAPLYSVLLAAHALLLVKLRCDRCRALPPELFGMLSPKVRRTVLAVSEISTPIIMQILAFLRVGEKRRIGE